MSLIKLLSRCSALLLATCLSANALAEAIWIDVRSADEFNSGHLPGAIHIVHTDIAGKIAAVTTDKNAEIQLYCRSGRRSGLAEAALKQLGYTNVHNAGAYEKLAAAPKAQP